jgi:hypothetical protein
VVYTSEIRRTDNHTKVGQVLLEYSSQFRCVRAVAVLTAYGPDCDHVTSYVYKPSTRQINASDGAVFRLAVTPWVNDAGIRQSAWAQKWCGGQVVAEGMTPAY